VWKRGGEEGVSAGPSIWERHGPLWTAMGVKKYKIRDNVRINFDARKK